MIRQAGILRLSPAPPAFEPLTYRIAQRKTMQSSGARPLSVRNLETSFGFCAAELAEGAPAGTFVFKLQGGGLSEQAFCRWARRLGP